MNTFVRILQKKRSSNDFNNYLSSTRRLRVDTVQNWSRRNTTVNKTISTGHNCFQSTRNISRRLVNIIDCLPKRVEIDVR